MSYKLDSLHYEIDIETGNQMAFVMLWQNVINFLSFIAWKAYHMLNKPEDLAKEIRKSQTHVCLFITKEREKKEKPREEINHFETGDKMEYSCANRGILCR